MSSRPVSKDHLGGIISVERDPKTLNEEFSRFIQTKFINTPSLSSPFPKNPFIVGDDLISTPSADTKTMFITDLSVISDTLSTVDSRDTPYGRQHISTKIIARMTKNKVLKELEMRGLQDFAKRIRHLYNVTEEDEEPIKLNSLRNFAIFMITNRGMTQPQITITPEGLIHATWRHPTQGTLGMNFQEFGDISYMLLYGRWDQKAKRHQRSGDVPADDIMLCVGDFIHRTMRT